MGAVSRWGALVVAAAMLAALWAAPAGAAQPIPDATTFERVDQFLAQEVVDAAIPGLSVAVVVGDQVAHTTSLGVADGAGRPVTADTPFVLASVSKAFTAMAIMQLVESGSLELNAPVQRYLPWFRVADEQASAQITLDQLLHHTSGLPQVGPPDEQDEGALERFIRSLADVQLNSVPGSEYNYTNVAYDILALVVQTVSGVPYDKYVAERVFGPLGMTHSHALVADARADGASEGFYRWFGLAATPTRVPYPRAEAAAATIFSSANDMGRWLIAHMNGGSYGGVNILSPGAIAALHTPAVVGDPGHGYAMGWAVRPLWEGLDPAPGVPTTAYDIPALIEHGGSWATGHTYVGFVPDLDWGFVMLMNINDRTVESRYQHVEQGLLSILSGGEPDAAQTYEPPLIRYGKQIALVLLLLEVISPIWALGMILRWRLPEHRPRRLRTVIIALAVPLVFDALILYLFFVAAPAALGGPLDLSSPFSPDLPFIIWPPLLLAGIWGPVRTLLFAYLLVRRPARPVATSPG